jgi:DNA recombination protein RmuC
MQPVLFLLIGIVVGGLIGWLFGKLMAGKNSNVGELNSSKLEQEKLSGKLELLQQEKIRQEKFFQEQIIRSESGLKEEREKNMIAEKKLAQLDAMYKATEEKWLNQKNEIEELQKKSRIEFENIANKLLKEKGQEFTDQNKLQLDVILNPLKEKIVSFEKKVDDNYKEEFREKASLKEQIKNLVDLNQKISQEANNLVTALKGNNKTQGNWGEMILERILEVSGLTKDQEYKTQYSTNNEEGKRLQPDVVIILPDEKNMVIDAKVSLVAYEQFINAETEEEKVRFLKLHIESVRSHVRILGDKNYTELAGVKTPDFILLFVPIEASFAAVLQGDPELYNYAWDRKIILVSPTTLLATLRTVSSVWKQEKQIKNALKIAVEAGNMYDKFVAVTEDLLKVGKSIDASKNLYVDAMNKFVEGKGNLLKRAEDLRELGIKTSKNFDPKLIDRSNQNLFDKTPDDEE